MAFSRQAGLCGLPFMLRVVPEGGLVLLAVPTVKNAYLVG